VSSTRQEVITWARQVVAESEALILDTETTGLEAHDEVIQLAIVDLQGNVLLQTLVRPTVPVGTEARAIHGITDEVLAEASSFAQLHETIAGLLGNRSVLAYHADFDRRLLAQTCAKYGLPPLAVAAWGCGWSAMPIFGANAPLLVSTNRRACRTPVPSKGSTSMDSMKRWRIAS
jgi:DNA polymerase-3 subunit epsilon